MSKARLRLPRLLSTFRAQILFFLGLVLIALIVSRFIYSSGFERIPQAVVSSIDPAWLGSPGHVPSDFSAWEDFERDMSKSYPLRQLVITKLDRNQTERIVHPFHLPLSMPDYLESDAQKAQRLPIEKQGQVLGYAYVHLDTGRIRMFHTLFWVLVLLVVSGSAGALLKFRFQQRSIESISFQLQEKKRELTELEKLALVGQLTANILHDLKKPILNIRDEAETLKDGEVKASILEQADLFLTLLREVNLEGFLSRDILNEEFVDLKDVIDRSFALVKYEMGNVNVELDFSPDTPFILAVKHPLVQVFSNLFLNAFEAMKGHGTLKVRVSRTQTDEALYAYAEVRDTGSGVPENVREDIFEPFFTYGKTGGSSGLGLYITREIIEDLGGQITLRPEESSGTTFEILLPATLDQD